MTDKTIVEEWENIFFKVYGENIINLFRDAYRYRSPGKADGNIYFEAGMDFIEMIISFIRTQLTLAEKRGQEKAEKEFNSKKYSYQQAYRKRQTELGNCRTCGKKAVVRGKCERHRKMDLLNGKNYRQRKKDLKQSQEEDLCHCHGNDPTHELGEYKIHCKHCKQFQNKEEK